LLFSIALLLSLASCGIYSFTGADTSGASTFSVDYFRPETALATPVLAQSFTESLKDLILQQSTLNISDNGELHYEGAITSYEIAPVSVQSNETASLNRLSITVKVVYTNTIEPSKSFERSFSKYADYDSSQDILSVEDDLNNQIIAQLTQEIFNASLGNW